MSYMLYTLYILHGLYLHTMSVFTEYLPAVNDGHAVPSRKAFFAEMLFASFLSNVTDLVAICLDHFLRLAFSKPSLKPSITRV